MSHNRGASLSAVFAAEWEKLSGVANPLSSHHPTTLATDYNSRGRSAEEVRLVQEVRNRPSSRGLGRLRSSQKPLKV